MGKKDKYGKQILRLRNVVREDAGITEERTEYESVESVREDEVNKNIGSQ